MYQGKNKRQTNTRQTTQEHNYGDWDLLEKEDHHYDDHEDIDLEPITIGLILSQEGALAMILDQVALFLHKVQCASLVNMATTNQALIAFLRSQEFTGKSDLLGAAETGLGKVIAGASPPDLEELENNIREIVLSMPVWHEANFHRYLEHNHGYVQYDDNGDPFAFLNEWGAYDEDDEFQQHYDDPWHPGQRHYPNQPPHGQHYYGPERPHQNKWKKYAATGAGLLSLFS